MALIGTIRKNFWFVLILLGFALAAFIIMDMTSAANLGGGGTTQASMGKVNGTDIDYREFQTTESVLFSGAGGDVYERRNSLWNYMIDKAIVSQEAKKLGMGVSEQEIMDLEFGANMSPIIRQNFTNPQTGQVDFTQLQTIRNQIETGVDMDPGIRQFWVEQRKQIITGQLQDKLNLLSTKAMYTPTWMAEVAHTEENATVDFEYVKVPFDRINDPSIEVSDQDYKNYLSNNATAYTNDEETKALHYAVFDVLPTSADSAQWRTEINAITNDFRSTTDDSLFIVSNEGVYQNFYFPKDQLTPLMQDMVGGMSNGEVSEPFIENGRYNTFKMIDSKLVPDSVEVRHILRRTTVGNTLTLSAAETMVDSLIIVLRNRQNNFDSLAAKFSEDPTTSTNGGNMGMITQGSRVAPLNDLCFYTGSRGNYYKVITQAGVHIVEILDQVYNDRDPKYKIGLLGLPIIPSKETQDKIYEDVAELIGANPYWDALSAELSNRSDITVSVAENLKQNDYVFADLGGGNTSRDIIKWAFEPGTSVNDVSPNVFTYTDEINYFNNKYVVSALKNESPAGLMSVEAARDDIEFLVLNQKKGEFLVDKVAGSNLSSVANEYSSSIDTVRGVSFGSLSIPGLGREPDVIGLAFQTALNSASAPIVGNEGVYIVRPTNKTEAGAAPNLVTLKTLNTSSKRAAAGFKLFEGLRKKAKVEDKRFTFF